METRRLKKTPIRTLGIACVKCSLVLILFIPAYSTVEILSGRLKRLGMTQSDFADICEVTPKTVSNWVRGKTDVNPMAEVRHVLMMKWYARPQWVRSVLHWPVCVRVDRQPRPAKEWHH